MQYYPLSFENDLFTARVYKRNYRNKRSQRQQREELTGNHETIIQKRSERQQNEAPLGPKLHSSSQGKTKTTVAAIEQYDRDAEPIVPGVIKVSTICKVWLTRELEGNLEHRVGSSDSGQNGLY